jgi:hypothetical protein
MADFSATDVAFSGIRFVRERPRTVALWSGVQILLSLVLGGLLVAVMGPDLAQLASLGRQPQTDPTRALAALSRLLPMYAVLLPVMLVINGVVYAAMARAVLRPAETVMGYLRFGRDELLQILLNLLWILIIVGAYIAGLLVVVIPTVIVTMISKGLAVLGVLFGLVVLAAFVYGLVRLSLSSAMTFDRRRVSLLGSWTLTRGCFWKMFGAYGLVVGLALVIVLLVSIISTAVAAVFGGVGGLAVLFTRSGGTLNDFFAPARLAVTVVWAVATPLFWALFLMPPAEIYRRLSGAADPAFDPSTFD